MAVIASGPLPLQAAQLGAVADVVEITVTDGNLRRVEVTRLSGEVNKLGWLFRQRLPAINLAHRDLPGRE